MKACILALLVVSTVSLAKEKQAVIRNESFIVMCNLTLPEGSSYVWSLNGRPFDLTQFSVTNQSTQGLILGQSIRKTNAVDGDNGTYTCQVDQNSVSSSVFVTDEPKITILGPEHKYAYVDKDKTIQVHVDYQGGDVSLNLIINTTKVAVPGTVQHKTVFGNETFNITLSNVENLQEDDSYVAALRGSDLIRNSTITRFYSRPFPLTIKRKPPTPRLSVLTKGPGYADFKLMKPSAEPSHHYDTVNNFSVSFSTMWGQTDKKVLNAPVSEFRLNSLYPWTLYNVTVTAHGSETQSEPSFLTFSTTSDPDKPVGFLVIPKTHEVGSNASGPRFPVCYEHQSLGNCTTAVKEIRNVSFTSPDWCYLLDFNKTASLEEWVVVSEGLPYFRVVLCNLCHPLKACRVGGANDKENRVSILVTGLLLPLVLLVAIVVTLFYRKYNRQPRVFQRRLRKYQNLLEISELIELNDLIVETACARESNVCSAPVVSFCCRDGYEAKEDVTVVGVLSSSNTVVLSVDHKNIVFSKRETISMAIGPDGGNLSLPLSGVFVSVPAGALTTVEELTVSIFQPEGKESKSDPKLNLIEFLPHGTTFSKDVSVRLPFNKENGSGSLLRLFHADGYNCTENYEPVALLETGETSCFLNEEKQMKFQIHDGYLLMQSSSFCRLCEYEEGDTPYNLAVSVFYRNRPVTGQEYCLDLTICLCCAHTKTQENMTDSMNKDNYKKCGFCTILCDSTFKQSLSVRVDPEQTGWKQKPSGEITFSSEKLTYSRNCSFRQFVTTNFMLTKSTVLTSFPHGSVTCSLYNISSNGSYKVDSAIIPLTSSPPGTRSISSSVSLQSSETQSGLSCGAQSLSRDGKTHDSPVLASLKENGSRIGFSLEKKSEFSKGFSDSSIYKCPSPKQLWKLAKLLGTEWKGVARSLNIPDADIKTICSSESDPKEQTMAMLHIWLNKEATSASIKALCIALREEDRTKDAVDVFEICEKLILGL